MHFVNQQIDHRRCFLCAEPITGPICDRCGHLHDVRCGAYALNEVFNIPTCHLLPPLPVVLAAFF